MIGCGESQVDPIVDRIDETPKPQEPKDLFADAIDLDKLQKRGREGEETLYLPNSDTPYTGKVIGSRDPSGKPWELFNFKGGKLDGLATRWYENGQKWVEESWKNGKRDGLLILWSEYAMKQEEANWKDGKLVTITIWKPNGEKCPITNVVEGNGVLVLYNDDGTIQERVIFKNGEPVKN